MRLLVIGAGGIAQNYPDVMAAAGAKVVQVVDTDAARAEALAERFGCPWSATPAYDGADAAVVAVPPSAHGDVVHHAMASGLDVLCEKPLAHTLPAARQMVEAAEHHGRVLRMATKYRTCPDVLASRRLVLDGAIGRVLDLEVAFTARVDMRGRWNADPAVAGGGVIMDNGSHALDLAAFVAGDLADVLTVEGPRPEGLAVEDSVHLHARTAGGAHVHVDLTWTFDKALPDFLRVYGTEGEVRVGWRDARWRRWGGEWTEIGPGYAKIPAMAGVVQAFVTAVDGDDDGVLSDGRHVALALDAAYRSLRSGSPEPLERW